MGAAFSPAAEQELQGGEEAEVGPAKLCWSEIAVWVPEVGCLL